MLPRTVRPRIAIPVIAVVVLSASALVAVSAAKDDRQTAVVWESVAGDDAGGRAPELQSTTRPVLSEADPRAGDGCGADQVGGGLLSEYTQEYLDSTRPPGSPQEAINASRAASGHPLAAKNLVIEKRSKSSSAKTSGAEYVARDEKGAFVASYDLYRGKGGGWVVTNEYVCQDIPDGAVSGSAKLPPTTDN